MALYTERHGMRNPIEKTETISCDMYDVLLRCCEKYYDNLIHLFSKKCRVDFTHEEYLKFDKIAFQTKLRLIIPELFIDRDGEIISPRGGIEYIQYALLDLIEYIAQNAKDILKVYNHYQNYWRIDCLDTSEVFGEYQQEINKEFEVCGLLYRLTDEKKIERTPEFNILMPEIKETINTVKEPGLKDLLNDAVSLFHEPRPKSKQDAVEKIWDAFERLKTFRETANKKASINNIVKEMSCGCEKIQTLFDAEFLALTKIGNEYRIRHHEKDKIGINDARHLDYLFNRCLSLIALALKYLERETLIFTT